MKFKLLLCVAIAVAISVQFIPSVVAQTTPNPNFRQMTCHYCHPQTKGVDCAKLGSDETLQFCTNLGIGDVIISCYSAYLDYENVATPNARDETGVHRGCAMRQESIPDYCALLRDDMLPENATMVSCAVCDEDGCNNHKFDAQGNIISSGQTLHSMSVVVLLAAIGRLGQFMFTL